MSHEEFVPPLYFRRQREFDPQRELVPWYYREPQITEEFMVHFSNEYHGQEFRKYCDYYHYHYDIETLHDCCEGRGIHVYARRDFVQYLSDMFAGTYFKERIEYEMCNNAELRARLNGRTSYSTVWEKGAGKQCRSFIYWDEFKKEMEKRYSEEMKVMEKQTEQLQEQRQLFKDRMRKRKERFIKKYKERDERQKEIDERNKKIAKANDLEATETTSEDTETFPSETENLAATEPASETKDLAATEPETEVLAISEKTETRKKKRRKWYSGCKKKGKK